jgi:hypothetical protein
MQLALFYLNYVQNSLRKAGKARIAIMVDSPYHMYDQTRFSIKEAGVKNIRTHWNGKVI